MPTDPVSTIIVCGETIVAIVDTKRAKRELSVIGSITATGTKGTMGAIS